MTDQNTQIKPNQPVAEQSVVVNDYTAIKPGLEVKIYEKIKELNPKGEEKERIQIFQGLVMSRRGGNGKEATVTVRKTTEGVWVEKIFPLSLPAIDKIEVVKQFKTNKAKLYFVDRTKRKLKEVKKVK